jgi:hypothetical protein
MTCRQVHQGDAMKYITAAIALAIACPLPATAQQFPITPGGQVDCLMRSVPEETRISAVHAYLESVGATRSNKEAAIAAALDSCGKTHSWTNEQHSMAYDAMMYKTRMDELGDTFNAIKVDSVVAARVAGLLMYAEKKLLLDRDWRNDAALDAHVRSLLAAQGITDQETQHLGGDLVYALHNYINLIERWEARWPTPPLPLVGPPPLVAPPPPPPPRPRTPAPPG